MKIEKGGSPTYRVVKQVEEAGIYWLVKLLVSAFDRQGLQESVSFDLAERLDVITEPDRLGVMANRVVQWSLDRGDDYLARLINAMLRERPQRKDISAFFSEMAERGFLSPS